MGEELLQGFFLVIDEGTGSLYLRGNLIPSNYPLFSLAVTGVFSNALFSPKTT
jgi:hypothetical protein